MVTDGGVTNARSSLEHGNNSLLINVYLVLVHNWLNSKLESSVLSLNNQLVKRKYNA